MKKHIGGTLLALAMILALLTACGGGKSANGNSASSAPAATDTAAEGPSGAPEAPMDPEQGEYGYYQESASLDQGGNNALRDAKIIRTANLEMETTAFDGAVESLSRLTKEMGGYYENSSLRTGGSGYRWADYTVRVPAERYDEFLLRAGELCNLTWRSESAENVTEAYYDTEGRLRTQQIKLERLQELLSRAEVMEDIITIESAISETEYQIESLSGTLRRYDALVDFATVSINLREVYKLSSVEEVPDSFAARIGSAFAAGLTAFTSGAENLIVGLAYSWVWLLTLAVILAALLRFLWKHKRRFTAGKAEKTDDNAPKT